MSLASSHLVKATVLLTLAAATLAFSAPAFADRPTELPVLGTFTGVNACTGLEETVTASGTIFRHFHGDQESHLFPQTITTSSGFVGRATEVGVLHERIFVVNVMLTNDAT